MQTSAPQFRGVLNSICEILPKLLIDEPQKSSIVEIYGDTADHHGKFERMKIARYGCIDTNEDNLKKNKEKWYGRSKREGTFLCMELGEQLPSNVMMQHQSESLLFDYATCYSVKFEHNFVSEERARMFLTNCAHLIRPGGYFFGYCFDSSQSWSIYQKEIAKREFKRNTIQIKRGIFSLTISNMEDGEFTHYGTTYELAIEGEKVKRSGYMIHFPSFIRIAKESGFRVISLDNMQQFYDDYKDSFHDTFKSFLVYRKQRAISQNDASLIAMFNIFILQRIEEPEEQ